MVKLFFFIKTRVHVALQKGEGDKRGWVVRNPHYLPCPFPRVLRKDTL